ncbi:hypothetical protein V5J35_004314 [Endozoicomonas sp. NE40]|uniref:Uncharacterized protein n=1 Tax=Endozoicomonas lisbonensis TaxID=3120522 RepID=A0ABV2SMY0_9GAMM
MLITLAIADSNVADRMVKPSIYTTGTENTLNKKANALQIQVKEVTYCSQQSAELSYWLRHLLYL